MTFAYVIDGQVGFLLRRAHQRHVSLFTTCIKDDLTPTQFAALAKLNEIGCASQNSLGRQTAMDVATIKGVVHRLRRRGLIEKRGIPGDRRKVEIALTPLGVQVLDRCIVGALEANRLTLEPLDTHGQEVLLRLLAAIG